MKSSLNTTWQSLAAPPSHPGKTAWPRNSTASFWSSHYWMIIQNTSLWEQKMWALSRWSQTTYSSMGRPWCWWARTRDMRGHGGHLADSSTPPPSPVFTKSHGKPHLVNFLRDIQHIFAMPQKLQMWRRQCPRWNLEDIPLVCFSYYRHFSPYLLCSRKGKGGGRATGL